MNDDNGLNDYELYVMRWMQRAIGQQAQTYITTNTTTAPARPLTEADVRRIVREEMADLVKPDIPDAPPEDMR